MYLYARTYVYIDIHTYIHIISTYSMNPFEVRDIGALSRCRLHASFKSQQRVCAPIFLWTAPSLLYMKHPSDTISFSAPLPGKLLHFTRHATHNIIHIAGIYSHPHYIYLPFVSTVSPLIPTFIHFPKRWWTKKKKK